MRLIYLLFASSILYLSFATRVSLRLKAPQIESPLSSTSSDTLSSQSSHKSDSSHSDKASSIRTSQSSNDANQHTRRRTPKYHKIGTTSEEVTSRIKAMSSIQQKRLYYHAVINLARPGLTLQDWTDLQHNQPQLAAKVYHDWQAHCNTLGNLAYYRRELEKRPNDPVLLAKISSKGWSTEDLKPHIKSAKYSDSPREARLRTLLGSQITKLRRDSQLIQGHKQLSPYITRRPRWNSKEFQTIEGPASDVEVEMMQAIKIVETMRKVMRTTPYDASLVPLRDELQSKLRKVMRHTKYIELPQPPLHLPRDSSTQQASSQIDWTSASIPKGQRSFNRIARKEIRHPGGLVMNRPLQSGPLFLHAMHQKYDTMEKKKEFISSLFEGSDEESSSEAKEQQRRKTLGDRTAAPNVRE